MSEVGSPRPSWPLLLWPEQIIPPLISTTQEWPLQPTATIPASTSAEAKIAASEYNLSHQSRILVNRFLPLYLHQPPTRSSFYIIATSATRIRLACSVANHLYTATEKIWAACRECHKIIYRSPPHCHQYSKISLIKLLQDICRHTDLLVALIKASSFIKLGWDWSANQRGEIYSQ